MMKMDAVWQAFISGVPTQEAIASFLVDNPEHQLALGMQKIKLLATKVKMRKISTLDFEYGQAIAEIKQISYEEYAVEDQILFLNMFCFLYTEAREINGARSVLSAIKKLVSPYFPPEIQIIPMIREAYLHYFDGYHTRFFDAMEKVLETLSSHSGMYNRAYWLYVVKLCLANDFERFEKHFLVYAEMCKDLKYGLDFILMLRDTEMCDFHHLEAHIKMARAGNLTEPEHMHMVIREKFARLFSQNDFEQFDETNPFEWMLISLAHILKKEPEKALLWAHKHMRESGVEELADFKMRSDFFTYTLARAELANKNINVATYLLEDKRKRNNICVYDDFFWFRIFHIKGEKKKAQHHFNLFIANVEKYQLDNRLDIEFRLSPELTLADIRRYSHGVGKHDEVLHSSVENSVNQKDNSQLDFIIGSSEAIVHLKTLIKKYALVDTTVLIVGETGTGKELVAKALGEAGSYKDKPFVAINCGAISDHLLQSELFGHKKGAFTGAFQDHKGLFEEAKDGIVFLDEIGEISQAMQVSLLRILEAREYRPIGSNENKKLDCKIIAATNRDLSEHVKAGHFRQDLLYRLERLTIEIPALRERVEDIPLLIHHFLNDINPTLPPIFFDEEAIQHLMKLQWEGNIRELKNEMERIRLLCSDKKILTKSELSKKYNKDYVETASSVDVEKSTKVETDQPAEKPPIGLKSKFRRLEELKKIFKKHKKLTRIEVENLLQISTNTALSYLATLEQESFIVRKAYANSKTYYYEVLS